MNIGQIVESMEINFSGAGEINDDGVLLLRGTFPTEPETLSFALKFLQSEGEWKPLGIKVDNQQSGTTAAAFEPLTVKVSPKPGSPRGSVNGRSFSVVVSARVRSHASSWLPPERVLAPPPHRGQPEIQTIGLPVVQDPIMRAPLREGHHVRPRTRPSPDRQRRRHGARHFAGRAGLSDPDHRRYRREMGHPRLRRRLGDAVARRVRRGRGGGVHASRRKARRAGAVPAGALENGGAALRPVVVHHHHLVSRPGGTCNWPRPTPWALPRR